MSEAISNALEEACGFDGLEIDWDEVKKESQQDDKDAWDRLAEKIWNREI